MAGGGLRAVPVGGRRNFRARATRAPAVFPDADDLNRCIPRFCTDCSFSLFAASPARTPTSPTLRPPPTAPALPALAWRRTPLCCTPSTTRAAATWATARAPRRLSAACWPLSAPRRVRSSSAKHGPAEPTQCYALYAAKNLLLQLTRTWFIGIWSASPPQHQASPVQCRDARLPLVFLGAACMFGFSKPLFYLELPEPHADRTASTLPQDGSPIHCKGACACGLPHRST